MANDMENIDTVELVSSEVSGHLSKDGQFVYGEPQSAGEAREATEVFTQNAEDAIAG